MAHIRILQTRGVLLIGLMLIIGALVARPAAVAKAQPATPGGYSPVVELTGAVQAPQQFTLVDLQLRPAVRAAHRCIDPETGRIADHAYRGVRLWYLLAEAGIAIPERISTLPTATLHASLVATGSDGYQVLIALAEIDPAFNGREAIIAYERDGQQLGEDLGMAILVLPDDRTCDRDVYWLTRLEVRFIENTLRAEAVS